MKNIFSKANAPYLASGALAIVTLLASGVFAVAPYVGFLASAAALSLGLPFIIGGAIFSAVVIALSAVVIQKNGAIRRQSTLLHEEGKEKAELILKLKGKEAEVQVQQQEIAKQVDEIPNLKKQLDENKPFYDALDEISSSFSVTSPLSYLNVDSQNVSKLPNLSSIDAAKEHLRSL
ncbi:MAG: DUF2975 domain-containing protein [Wolbachia sp.]